MFFYYFGAFSFAAAAARVIMAFIDYLEKGGHKR